MASLNPQDFIKEVLFDWYECSNGMLQDLDPETPEVQAVPELVLRWMNQLLQKDVNAVAHDKETTNPEISTSEISESANLPNEINLQIADMTKTKTSNI